MGQDQALDLLQPWHVYGGGLDATLTPFYNKQSATNFGLLSAKTDQCFGTWRGSYHSKHQSFSFQGLQGWAEDVHNRW